MPEPVEPNVYIDDKIAALCNCPQKDEDEPSRKLVGHANRCMFRRRSVQWLGWANVDAIALAE